MTIQVGGGVRSKSKMLKIYSTLGADRVVIGSLAIKEPSLSCAELDRRHFGGEKIVLALDVKIDRKR